jgi:hypothetical protein
MIKSPQPLVIEIWHIDKFVFYSRNPRKNDAAVDRMCSTAASASSDSNVRCWPEATVPWWMVTSESTAASGEILVGALLCVLASCREMISRELTGVQRP